MALLALLARQVRMQQLDDALAPGHRRARAMAARGVAAGERRAGRAGGRLGWGGLPLSG
ncbi:hypothetical protein PSYPI_24954 [Pseudomonas syringae pv. pisi str. 1704B]|uniref:Uncharacterized protein n=1 Tax=Pseudomonas syringae pv. pisi str. 1704B TaxID=629263 RepID=F3GE92_PSESJ|nr:hypothetical protein PSYPI_24954 [Pseudomonas syringae pv. pisi str. 1704B]